MPKPGAKDLCPVCGMLVSKNTIRWLCAKTVTHILTAPRICSNISTITPKMRTPAIASRISAHCRSRKLAVNKVDARKAFYVIGSQHVGPMGHEFVPLETRTDAEEFLKDHKGKRIFDLRTNQNCKMHPR